ncbi:hypothetical protein NKH77_36805 [Streptomyces sp. M19]
MNGTTGPLLRIDDLHVEITGRARVGGPARTVRALDGVTLDLAPARRSAWSASPAAARP